MSHEEYLKALLAPLGIYDLEGPYNSGELAAQAKSLDGAGDWLDQVGRETDLTTAEDWGLERMAQLFARRPVADSAKKMRAALAALLRIGGDSFTLEAINDTISGCGVHARVDETDQPGTVEVSFPDVPGIPKGFEEISRIIEDILPAHLLVQYVYWYITWVELEQKITCWQDIEDRGLTWEQLETLVEEEE